MESGSASALRLCGCEVTYLNLHFSLHILLPLAAQTPVSHYSFFIKLWLIFAFPPLQPDNSWMWSLQGSQHVLDGNLLKTWMCCGSGIHLFSFFFSRIPLPVSIFSQAYCKTHQQTVRCTKFRWCSSCCCHLLQLLWRVHFSTPLQPLSSRETVCWYQKEAISALLRILCLSLGAAIFGDQEHKPKMWTIRHH